MRNGLLVAWVALLGATRIDFLGGMGPFVLTPFLVLSPILVLVEAWHLAGERWDLRIPPRAGAYLLTVSALLILLLASTFGSYDLATSAQRYALLLVQVAFVFVIGVMLANRPDPSSILVRGGYAGLALTFLFDLGQAAVYLQESLWPRMLESVVSMETATYMGVIPRLAGLSHDPNHGGLAIVFFLALVILFGRPGLLRSVFITLGVMAVVATLSRSAILAGGVLGVGLMLHRREVGVTPAAVGVAGAVVGLLTAIYLMVPGALDPVAELGDVIGNRFNLEEGSTSDHASLLARGWDVGTQDVKHVLLGIGYGNAYVTVQDIFPGNEYGNFHSLFVTFFAEAGAVAALLAIWMFAHVLTRAGPYWPLVAALIAFNFFQQSHTEPMTWVILLIAWLGIGAYAARTVRVGRPATSEPGHGFGTARPVPREPVGSADARGLPAGGQP